MHKYLINCEADFRINVDMIKSDETEIDAKEFITVILHCIQGDSRRCCIFDTQAYNYFVSKPKSLDF